APGAPFAALTAEAPGGVCCCAALRLAAASDIITVRRSRVGEPQAIVVAAQARTARRSHGRGRQRTPGRSRSIIAFSPPVVIAPSILRKTVAYRAGAPGSLWFGPAYARKPAFA